MTESAVMPKLSWHGIRPACRKVLPCGGLVQIAQRRGVLRLISGVVPDARARGADLRRPPGAGRQGGEKGGILARKRRRFGGTLPMFRAPEERKAGETPVRLPSGSRPARVRAGGRGRGDAEGRAPKRNAGKGGGDVFFVMNVRPAACTRAFRSVGGFPAKA